MTRIPHLVLLATLAVVSNAGARDVRRSGAVYDVAACAHAVGPMARCHARIVTTPAGAIVASARAR